MNNASSAALVQISSGSCPNTTNKWKNSIGDGQRANKKKGQQGIVDQSATLADRNDDDMEVERVIQD